MPKGGFARRGGVCEPSDVRRASASRTSPSTADPLCATRDSVNSLLRDFHTNEVHANDDGGAFESQRVQERRSPCACVTAPAADAMVRSVVDAEALGHDKCREDIGGIVSVTRQRYQFVSRMCGRSSLGETVSTEARFTATPDEIWKQLMFYEDVPDTPVFLLRALLPYPVRAEGDKTSPRRHGSVRLQDWRHYQADHGGGPAASPGIRSRSAVLHQPDRGRRNWKENQTARDAVYRNRRRIRGPRGLRLLRLRGERLERSFAHLYETGGLRRVYLRGHANIRKRLLIHAGGFNLGLLMRQLIGVGTPRGLQGRLAAVLVALLTLIRTLSDAIPRHRSAVRRFSRLERLSIGSKSTAQIGERKLAFTTGC